MCLCVCVHTYMQVQTPTQEATGSEPTKQCGRIHQRLMVILFQQSSQECFFPFSLSLFLFSSSILNTCGFYKQKKSESILEENFECQGAASIHSSVEKSKRWDKQSNACKPTPIVIFLLTPSLPGRIQACQPHPRTETQPRLSQQAPLGKIKVPVENLSDNSISSHSL